MDFMLDTEQQALARTVRELLADADAPEAARRWAAGDHGPGRRLWAALGELGLPGLLVPEDHGGLGLGVVETVACLYELGRQVAPGPWVETVAVAPLLLAAMPGRSGELAGIAGGALVATVGADGVFLDADVADLVVAMSDGQVAGYSPATCFPATCSPATLWRVERSVDPVRRLYVPDEDATPRWRHEVDPGVAAAAYDAGALGTAAVILGAGRAAIDMAAQYAGQRQQFGRAIGEFQAVKHLLADALTRQEFAEPVLYGAAVAVAAGTADASRDVSAAKIVAADAARLAVTTALQVHGAIGYTDEYQLSMWIRRVTALRSAWGSVDRHRARVADALAGAADLPGIGQRPAGPTTTEVPA